MSAIDAFYRVWADARQTFGSGLPQRGEGYDKSAQLTTFARDLDQAAPRQQWTGSAANAYSDANTEHQQVFTRLAELDRKISAHVTASAEVVAAGRQNLDAVRDWVTAAANSVPPGRLRDAMLTQIANKGLTELSEVVRRSNADANTIAEACASWVPSSTRSGAASASAAPRSPRPTSAPPWATSPICPPVTSRPSTARTGSCWRR